LYMYEAKTYIIDARNQHTNQTMANKNIMTKNITMTFMKVGADISGRNKHSVLYSAHQQSSLLSRSRFRTESQKSLLIAKDLYSRVVHQRAFPPSRIPNDPKPSVMYYWCDRYNTIKCIEYEGINSHSLAFPRMRPTLSARPDEFSLSLFSLCSYRLAARLI
jgi:hypothetical protein